MIKLLLLLQQLYNLSDQVLEYQVLDRRSFQRFLGSEHSGLVPDAKTVLVWRERLKAYDLMADIGAAVNGQLQRAGFIARSGQIIDASIVNAPIQRNTRQENARVNQGEVLEAWSDARRAQKDVQARWTKKHGKSYYGYKLHANTDRRRGFIRRHEVSAADVHGRQHFETLLDPGNTGRTVRAGSAYADRAREADLKRRGYHVDIQPRGGRISR